MADRNRSQVREVINRNTVVSLALEQGYNVFLPVYDGGIDFIFYREQDGEIQRFSSKAVGRSTASTSAATSGSRFRWSMSGI